MKIQIVIFLILCINFALSSDDRTLEPKKTITIEAPTDGKIYFFFNSNLIDTSEEDKSLIFQITSLKGSLTLEHVSYIFIDSIDDFDISTTNSLEFSTVLIESLKEVTYENKTNFQQAYFTIKKVKNTDKNFIFIEFSINMIGTQKIYVEISNLEKFPETPKDDKTAPKTEHNYLKKI